MVDNNQPETSPTNTPGEPVRDERHTWDVAQSPLDQETADALHNQYLDQAQYVEPLRSPPGLGPEDLAAARMLRRISGEADSQWDEEVALRQLWADCGISDWSSRLPGQLAELADAHPEMSDAELYAAWRADHPYRQVSTETLATARHTDIRTVELPAVEVAATPDAAGEDEVDSLLDAERLVEQVCDELVASSSRAGELRARMLRAVWAHVQASDDWNRASLAAELGIPPRTASGNWRAVAAATRRVRERIAAAAD